MLRVQGSMYPSSLVFDIELGAREYFLGKGEGQKKGICQVVCGDTRQSGLARSATRYSGYIRVVVGVKSERLNGTRVWYLNQRSTMTPVEVNSK